VVVTTLARFIKPTNFVAQMDKVHVGLLISQGFLRIDVMILIVTLKMIQQVLSLARLDLTIKLFSVLLELHILRCH
jgi:hypothetical protein